MSHATGVATSTRFELSNLDQLQRFAARAFDHHGASVAELIGGLLEECDAFASELGDPGVEIGDAKRDVISQMSTRARERLVSLTRVPGQRHVAEHHGRPGRAGHPILSQRRPRALRPARYLAV